VRDHEGKVVAAISVGGPDARLAPDRLEEIAEMVQDAAGRISQRLGYRAVEAK
jgi:DNA-binding IclR family transcriptional regulator